MREGGREGGRDPKEGGRTHARPQQIPPVWDEWQKEIEPFQRTILGQHESGRLGKMDVEHRWCYMKYRFDVKAIPHHYCDEAPPPQPMWQDNILHFHTPTANAWLLR